MRKQILTGVTLAGAVLAFGCGNDRDSFNDVVLPPTATATTTTTTRTTTSTSSTTTTTTTSTTATNTVPANALYIQPGAPAGGSGSSASPYNTIAGAAAAAPAGAFLYVLPAANNAVITETTITLKDGQQLVGKGAPSVASGKTSGRVIAGNTYPRLSGNVVLANNNTVSGFEFVSPVGSAIAGNGINGANINNIKVTGATLVAVNLLRVSGAVSVTDSDIEASGATFSDLIRVRTDEFSDDVDDAPETRGSASGAAAATDITVTGNLLLGNGVSGGTRNGMLIGSDEVTNSSFRPSTRLRNVNLSSNVIRFVNSQGIYTESADEQAAFTVNSNTLEYMRAGLYLADFGSNSRDALVVNDNQVKCDTYSADVELSFQSSVDMNRNNFAVNPSYANLLPTATPPVATTTDVGQNVSVDAAAGSTVLMATNTIKGGGTPVRMVLADDVATAAVTGYTKVVSNTFQLFQTATPPANIPQAEFNLQGVQGTQRLALRDNSAPFTLFSISASAQQGAVTAKLSILRNAIYNLSVSLQDNSVVKAEQSGTDGSTLFTASAAANTKTQNTDPTIGGQLGDLPAGGAEVP